MKILLEEMREIAKRLPIGYYLGRQVQVEIETDGNAYCDIIKGRIHIGIGLLQAAADHISAGDAAKWDREKMLRCLLYHEVGHILMTPDWAMGNVRVTAPSAQPCSISDSLKYLNIFEDERLEQILSQFFIGVDFKGFCNLVNRDAADPNTNTGKFYHAVRLRRTTPEISRMVDDAIEDLATVTKLTKYCDNVRTGEWAVDGYTKRLNEIIEAVVGQSSQSGGQSSGSSNDQSSGQQNGDQSGSQSPDGSSSNDKSSGDQPDSTASEDTSSDEQSDNGGGGKTDDSGSEDTSESGQGEDEDNGEDNGDDGSQDNDSQDGGAQDDGKSEGDKPDGDANSSGSPSGDSGSGSSSSSERGTGGDGKGSGDSNTADADPPAQKPRNIKVPQNMLPSVAAGLFVTPEPDVEGTLARFASRLLKKKGSQAAGCWSALHGKIDTKRDALDKDRIFRRKSDVGERIHTAVHMTLWVDSSGSFCDSEDALNKILTAVAKAEKLSNGNLSVDVVKMTTVAVVAKSREWRVDASGGTAITYSHYEAWKKTRRRDCRNIDIVVFDGNAKESEFYCRREGRAIDMPDGRKVESVIWDHPDCHIVCDTSNKKHFNKLKKAHVTYLPFGYAEQLKVEVMKILDRVL